MEAAQPGQGVELMLYGMGTVLLFLVLLVYAVRGMSAIVARRFPESPPTPTPTGASAAAARPVAEGIDPKLVAAIGAAVHEHRARGS